MRFLTVRIVAIRVITVHIRAHCRGDFAVNEAITNRRAVERTVVVVATIFVYLAGHVSGVVDIITVPLIGRRKHGKFCRDVIERIPMTVEAEIARLLGRHGVGGEKERGENPALRHSLPRQALWRGGMVVRSKSKSRSEEQKEREPISCTSHSMSANQRRAQSEHLQQTPLALCEIKSYAALILCFTREIMRLIRTDVAVYALLEGRGVLMLITWPPQLPGQASLRFLCCAHAIFSPSPLLAPSGVPLAFFLSQITRKEMGNICSKSANQPDDSFSQPGRVLGSSTASPPARAPVPSNAPSQSPGRTLGGVPSSGDTGDARSKAAEAAQKRAETLSASSKGKLGSQLAAQKAQTQSQTLNEASRAELLARNADNAAETRQWN
ncbi:hypothetical protein UA08_05464 [Talaromyces atroroseus]|uniref:Uncharacterized protein n=1 Tax=Talaromyces atroroseus TaxID=1441469 RepID=A0A225ANK4_TALAT|nr:hypothetical protein UA08_05464 [Talaromyces atroroseus]OKL58878.1 hypothetical protein UA08_05464 [Talaromyces atroroseus]